MLSVKQDRRGRRRRQRGLAPAPAREALEPADVAGLDRLAVEPAREVVGQRMGGRVAALGRLPKALQADRRQVARDQAVEPARVGRLILDDLGHQPGEVPPERDLAGEELEQDDPQRVDVAASIGAMPLAGRLLGRHVRAGSP